MDNGETPSADQAPSDAPQFGTLSEVNGPETAILDQLADLLAKHKLIPFFGAGISRRQLGFAAAELAQEIAPLVHKPPETLLSQLADDFIDQLGESAFISFLKSKLVLPEVDDAKVSAHRLLLSLSPRLLYTTNQDNVFELAARNYGRRYRPIVTLQDLSDAIPGEPLLIKFHGDPGFPSSLVFGDRSYQERIRSENHPLDIKLRADLLGKRLLFIGYSLHDENVNKLLDTVRRAAAGRLPPSYLLAFDYDSSMDGLYRTYGVEVINPRRLCPTASTNADAFERCLKELCDRTISIQASCGLEALFSGEEINARVATEFEVEAVERIAKSGPFEAGISGFRGAFDLALIPMSLRERVTDLFRNLTTCADPKDDNQMADLRGALLNLHLPAEFAIQALAALMALGNRRPERQGFDDFVSLPCPAVADGFNPVAAALAVTLLTDRGEVITDSFRNLAIYWFRGFEDLKPDVQKLIRPAIELAWPGHRAAESPLRRPPSPFRHKGFHQILAEMLAGFPKRFTNPKE